MRVTPYWDNRHVLLEPGADGGFGSSSAKLESFVNGADFPS